MPSKATNAVWAGSYDGPFGGCFGLNSVKYPPASRRNSRRRPSAADYAEKDQRPDQDQWQLDARKWSNVRLCRLLLSALLRIFAEQSVLRPPFRQGYFLPGGWALALAWGRARDEEEGACGARSKRPRLNPQLARASFLPHLASSRRGEKLCPIEGYFPPWKTKR